MATDPLAACKLECPGCGQEVAEGETPDTHRCPHDDYLEPVLGSCPHGVNLDHDFCPEGCRV